jgi:PKD repeat protein
VTVAWDANTEPHLSGYKIYYKTGSPGPPYDGVGATQGDSPIVIELDPNGDGDTSDGDLSDPASPEFTIDGLSDTETTYSVVTAYSVDDESGYSNELSFEPSPPANQPPTASFTANPTSGVAPLTVSFDATGSSDPDGTVASYTWAFGDSATGSGATTTHTYVAEGTFTVTLTVADDAGTTASATTTITVTATANQPPTASFTANPTSGEPPLNVSFDATGSSDPDGTVAFYSWAFGDSTTGSGATTTHTYVAEGTFTVTLTVTDDAGAAASATTTITVTATANQPPDPPVPSSPLDGDSDVSLTPVLQSGDFIDPEGDAHAQSQWQISDTSDFAWLALDITSGSHLTALTVPHSILDGDRSYYWRVRFFDDQGGDSGWSPAYSFTTEALYNDIDSNGVPDDQEVDASADVDNNGILDVDQMASDNTFKCINGNVQIAVKGITNVASIEKLEYIDPSTIADTTNRPADLPFGVISMKLTTSSPGDIAEVVVYFSEDLPNQAKWYKYDSVDGWQDYSQFATFNGDGRSITLELQDGAQGDSDGISNGVIVDPGAVAGTLTSGVETTASSNSGGGGGCFIATAAFGSPMEPHVQLLRDFRDNYLLTNTLGRFFVRLYTTYGPFAANYIREHGCLKPVVRLFLIPIVGLSYLLVKASLGTKILATLIPLGLMLLCIPYRWRLQSR